jgi:hypothetical protein
MVGANCRCQVDRDRVRYKLVEDDFFVNTFPLQWSSSSLAEFLCLKVNKDKHYGCTYITNII